MSDALPFALLIVVVAVLAIAVGTGRRDDLRVRRERVGARGPQSELRRDPLSGPFGT